MNYKEYENFIFNKGRDLEVSLFNHYFLNDDYSNCLLALSLYINEDGGISNINPNNLNNISTLSASIYFLDIITKLKYNNDEDYFNEIIKDLIKYLKKQKEFTYYHKTNIKKPCSNLYKENVYSFELEAITYAYISYYTNTVSNELNDIINKYINKEEVTFNEVYYFKIIESLFNNELLKEKIIKDTKQFLNNENLFKLIFNKEDYLLIHYKNEFINHKEFLLSNKNSAGLWETTNNWSDEYPEAEVAMIKYLSITLIDVLLFLEYIGEDNV